ncbi:MAG: EamA family transporter [Pseudomonadota bacterium]
MTRNAVLAVLLWSLSAPLALLGASTPNLFLSLSVLFFGAVAYWTILDRSFFASTLRTAKRVWNEKPVTTAIFTVGLIVYYLCWYYSLYTYSPAQAIIIIYLWAPILYFSQTLIFGDRTNRPVLDLIILFLAFTGAFFLVFEVQNTGTGGQTLSILPYHFAFLTAALPAVYMSAARKLTDAELASPTEVYQVGALIGLPAMLISGTITTLNGANLPSLSDVLPLLLLGVTSLAMAHTLYNSALDGSNNAFVSSVSFLNPVIVVSCLALFYGEPLSTKVLFGITLIIVANVMTSRLLDGYITVLATALGTYYVISGASFARYITTFQVDSGTLQALLAIFTLVAGFMLSQILSRRKTQLDALDEFAATAARIRMILTNRNEDTHDFDVAISKFVAKLARNRPQVAEEGRLEARVLAETVEHLCERRRDTDHLFDLAEALFRAGLAASTHHRGYFSNFEIGILLTLGMSLSTFAATTVFQSQVSLIGVVLLSCSLAFLLGKLVELNSFFGQTLTRQQVDFSKVVFGGDRTLILFRDDGNRPGDLCDIDQIWFNGAVLDGDDQVALARRFKFNQMGTWIVASLLMLALVAQITTISLGGSGGP